MLMRIVTLLRSRDGIAAVEFALVGPLLGILLVGTIEICTALECREKVVSTTSSLADLTAQVSSVSTTDISNIFVAGGSILYPFSSSNASIVMSSIVNNATTGQNTIDWSEAQNATPLAKNSVVTNVPAGVIAAGGSAILVQVTYNFTSPIGQFIGTIPMGDAFYSRPRQSTKVTCTNC